MSNVSAGVGQEQSWEADRMDKIFPVMNNILYSQNRL